MVWERCSARCSYKSVVYLPSRTACYQYDCQGRQVDLAIRRMLTRGCHTCRLMDLGKMQDVRVIVRGTREARTKGKVFRDVCGRLHGEVRRRDGSQAKENRQKGWRFPFHEARHKYFIDPPNGSALSKTIPNGDTHSVN
jgi:hypothetical protein